MNVQIKRSPWLIGLALCGCLALGSPASSAAQPTSHDEEARMHFRLGTAYYDSGRFDDAADEFQKAYELSGRPQLLYNLFLAHRDGGEIEQAADALRRFLADAPEVQEREMLEARLEALEKILAERAPAQPTVAAPAGDRAPHAAAAEAPIAKLPTAPEAPRLRWLPWTLLGSGAALVAAGVSVGVLGVRDEQRLEDDCPTPSRCTLSDREVEDLKDRGTLKTTLGDALWITGAVTASVGLAFVFWQPWERRHEDEAHLDLACGPTSCAARVTGRF